MLINCWTERKALEWQEAIEMRIKKFRGEITKEETRFNSFAPQRKDTYCHWLVKMYFNSFSNK